MITIQQIKLFEQEVTSVTTELTDKGNEQMANEKLIGWVHSHNTMSVFLSSVDTETANFNALSLVVNNKMEFFAKAQDTLPCGKKALLETIVILETNEDKEIETESEKLISIQTSKGFQTPQTIQTITRLS